MCAHTHTHEFCSIYTHTHMHTWKVCRDTVEGFRKAHGTVPIEMWWT
jgi:hypothetical protein